MMLSLSFIMVLLLHRAYCLIELQSMEIASCANKNVCHNDTNLRMVLTASASETSGNGSISGVITAGQTWTDSYGDWKLRESLTININYIQNAVWEYQLEDVGKFWTKHEDICGPVVTPCSSFENYVECANRGGYGLALLDSDSQYTKHTINNAEKKWNASISIESPHLNSEWAVSNTQRFIWE
eukprot:511571_1